MKHQFIFLLSFMFTYNQGFLSVCLRMENQIILQMWNLSYS